MKICCWTIARDRKLPDHFPVHSLQGTTLFVAGSQDDRYPNLQASHENFAACFNEAARRCGDGLLLTLPPDLIEFTPRWREILLEVAGKKQDGVFFYGNYSLRGDSGDQPQSVREDILDITEREDWGPVWAVRTKWLTDSGGLDEEHHRAAFYDLLLKSWGEGRRIHVGDSLAVIPELPENPTDELKNKLFFPGRGALGGFSYLFMDKEEEQHIENVFYNFLKREHAWLKGPRTAIPDTLTNSSRVVSVVTPVYNRATFIGEAIESVQSSILSDWEYIIVDNGSTDGTQDVIREYAEKDSRIRLIENSINMIALALNIGVRAAGGKYIAQLDSDDVHLPHTLQTMVDALENNPTWGLAISYYELMDVDGSVLPEFGVIKHEQYNRNNILRRDGAGALRCWHRSVILEFGGFDEKDLGHYGEDYDLVLKVGEKYEVGRVCQVCYRYRRHDDNTDVLRDPEMKIRNKTLARLRALERRRALY